MSQHGNTNAQHVHTIEIRKMFLIIAVIGTLKVQASLCFKKYSEHKEKIKQYLPFFQPIFAKKSSKQNDCQIYIT